MAVKKISKKAQARLDESLDATYNKFKEFEGRKYTGMKIGRSHKWYYDQGVWKETKVTPDEWEIKYAVTKRRAGKAPKGSGVPLGTEYHWYILGHQNVCKLDANSYTTALTGIKYKLAHKRADEDKWNISDKAQRKRLIKLLEETIQRLKSAEVDLNPAAPIKGSISMSGDTGKEKGLPSKRSKPVKNSAAKKAKAKKTSGKKAA